MELYPPMPLYVVFSIAVVFYSLVAAGNSALVSPNILRHNDRLLFLTWAPLCLYYVFLVIGVVFGWVEVYQDEPGKFIRIVNVVIVMVHWWGILAFLLWVVLFLKGKMQQIKVLMGGSG